MDEYLQTAQKTIESLLNPTQDERGVTVGFNPATAREALRARGHTVRYSPHSFDPTMSRAHAIWLGGDSRGALGKWQAGADPRGGAGVAWAW
jgi:gamma-glutamyltranspeptidase